MTRPSFNTQVTAYILSTLLSVLFFSTLLRSEYSLTVVGICDNATTISCGATISGTTIGGSNQITQYSCGNTTWSGSEAVYSFTITQFSTVTIALSNLSADLDLFLVGGGCETECLAKSVNSQSLDENIAFVLNTPGVYYVIIDGFSGAESTFDLSLTCTSLCDNATPITCGQTINGNTNTGTNNIDGDYCGTLSDHSGNELVYAITVDAGTVLELNIAQMTAQLNLFLLTEICDVGICLAQGQNTNGFDQNLKVEILQTGTYYIVVDGASGVTSAFELVTICHTLCSNTIPISCGVPISRNGFVTSVFSKSYCGSTKNYNSDEEVFEIVMPYDGILQVEVDLIADLDFFLFGADCNINNCIASNINTATNTTENLEVFVSAGTYYILVESHPGSGQNAHTLSINCIPALNASVDVNDAYIDLSWNLPKTNILGNNNYPLGVILELLDGSTTMVPGCEIPGVIHCEVFGNVANLNEEIMGNFRHEVGPDHTENYILRIRERDNGTTLKSYTIQGSTLPFQLPTMVMATDAAHPDSIKITWINHSKLADRFKIFRNGVNLSGDLGIEGVDVGMAAVYDDVYAKDDANSLVNGTAYNYCIEVFSTVHNQGYAQVCDNGSTYDINFTASDDNPVNSVEMAWDDVTSFCDRINITRDGIIIATLPNSATSYIDQSPIYGKVNPYSIKLYRSNIELIEIIDDGSVPVNGTMSGRVITQEGFYPVKNVNIELLKDTSISGAIQQVLVTETLTDFNGDFSFIDIFYDLSTEFSVKASKAGKAFEEDSKLITLSTAVPEQSGILFLENTGLVTSSTILNLNNFSATADNTLDKVTLAWGYTPHGSDITFFNIYRGSNVIASLNDLNGVINQYVDLEGIPNTEYIYTIEGFRVVESNNTVITSAAMETLSFPAVTTVKGLDVLTNVALGKVTLDWSVPAYTSSNMVGFIIVRNGVQIAELPKTASSFEDFFGEPGTQVGYQILAYRNVDDVDYESALFPILATIVTFPALAAPINVSATPKPDDDYMDISWTVPVALPSDYNYKGSYIYRKENGTSDFDLIGQLDKNFTPPNQNVVFIDRTGIPSMSYVYKVASVVELPDTTFESGVETAATAYPAVKMPPALTATPDFGNVFLDWMGHTSANHEGYEVYRNSISIATIPTGYLDYRDFIANPPNNSVNYEVKSFRIVDGQTYYSAPSTITSAPLDASATPLFMPFNVTASEDLANMVKVCWNYDPNINAQFIIKREGVVIATLDKGVRAYFDYNTPCGPDLQYEVIASKNALESFPAKVVGALRSIRIISGKVTRNLSKQGVGGVRMMAKDEQNGQEIYYAQTITDATGYYEFSGLPCIDNLVIMVTAVGENSDFTNGGNLDNTAIQSVTIHLNQLDYPLDFVDYFEADIEPGMAIPLAVTATPDPPNCRMIINWSPSNGNYTGFEIFRGPGMIGEVLNGQPQVFYDTEGVPGVEYFYGVRSYLIVGEERTESEIVSANHIFPKLFPVSNLTATFDPDANQAVLNWGHVYNNHDFYRIQRNDIVVATILTNEQLIWTDENIAPGKSYKYSVTAIKGLFASEIISINFTAAGVSEVKNLVATIPQKIPCSGETTSKNHVRLDWAYQAGAADGFEVYRGGILIAELTGDILTMGDNEALIGQQFDNGGGLFYYTDYLGMPSNNHQYEVVAFVLRDDIKISSGVAAAIPSVNITFPILSEVCGLIALAQTAEGNIILCLSYDSLSKVKGFYIYRDGIRMDTVFFTENPNGEVDTIIVKWIDDNGVPNANYSYSVKAFVVRDGVEYVGTNVCTVNAIYPAISVPQNFSASDGTYPDFIKVNWTYNANADIDRFEYQSFRIFNWSNSVTIGSGERTFLHTIIGGLTLPFRIRAVKIVNGTSYFSAWSNIILGSTSGSSVFFPETDTGDNAGDKLGLSVTIDEGLAAAGAPGGTGEEFYAYQINGSDLTFEGKTGFSLGIGFGDAIAMSGDHLIVGAPGNNGNEGKVYFYKWDGKDWNFVRTRFPVAVIDNHKAGSRFGKVVAIEGDRAVVGAPTQSSFLFPPSMTIRFSGVVYVYKYNGTTWDLEDQILGPFVSNAGVFKGFGSSVAISGDHMLVWTGYSTNSIGFPPPSRILHYERSGSDWEFKNDF